EPAGGTGMGIGPPFPLSGGMDGRGLFGFGNESAGGTFERGPGEENRKRDLGTKPEKNARAGIGGDWFVDPEAQRITVLTLDGDKYKIHGEFGPGLEATSVLLSGFKVSVDAVFAAGKG